MKKNNTSYGLLKIEIADASSTPPVFETLWERPKRLPRKQKKTLKKKKPSFKVREYDISANTLSLIVNGGNYEEK